MNTEEINNFNKNKIPVTYTEENSNSSENIPSILDLDTKIVTLSKSVSRGLNYVCYSSSISFVSPIDGEEIFAAVDTNPGMKDSRTSKLVSDYEPEDKLFLDHLAKIEELKQANAITEKIETAMKKNSEQDYQQSVTDMLLKHSSLPVFYVSNFNHGESYFSECTLNIFTGHLDLSNVKPIKIDADTEVVSTKIKFTYFKKDIEIDAIINHWGSPKINEHDRLNLYKIFEEEVAKINLNHLDDNSQNFKI